MQAGVGDQDVQRAKRFEGLGEQPLDVRLLRHIGPDGDGAAAVGVDFTGQRFGRAGTGVVVEYHCGTRVCQRPGRACANAGAGAGDQGNLSGEGYLHGLAP
ncbi:hypothetical protein D3C76_1437820 [compost metagenome]